MQDQCTNNMAAVITILYILAVPLKNTYVDTISMWTQSKYTFTYACIVAPYSKILTLVNFVHVNGA